MQTGPEGGIEEGRETRGGRGHVPAVMVIPAVALLAIGLALGFTPHARQASVAAAARFQDRQEYINRVLYGVWRPTPAPPVETSLAHAASRGTAAALIAALLAWAALFMGRLRARVESAIRPLRLLHSGHVGDYITWLTVGVAVFGAFLVGVIR